jgi:hypothetical protein
MTIGAGLTGIARDTARPVRTSAAALARTASKNQPSPIRR